jgi:signal transduction histidine kinase
MKKNKSILNLVVICLLCIYTTPIVAQQSQVDSAIQLLNKSLSSDKLDTVSIQKAFDILNRSTATDSEIKKIDDLAFSLCEKWNNEPWPYYIQFSVFYSLTNTDADKSIAYGKLQIENLDKLKKPFASSIISSYLTSLRFPFRNSNRFTEGFKYYTQKLNDYKIRNDSACIADCYFVLAGFYRISGIIDLAIYNMKKSGSFIDTLTNKSLWINTMGNIGNLYFIKGDRSECLRYSRMAITENLKIKREYAVNAFDMANMFLKSNELDSAAYFIKLGKEDIISRDIESIACFLQYEALYEIQSGDLSEAEALLNKSWQLIKENRIAVNPAPGTIAPDYYMALIRIKQNKYDDAIALLINDIDRLLNNRLDILRDYKLIAELYKKTGKNDKATETYASYITLQDSLHADQDKFRSYSFEAEQQMSEKELSIAKLESENKISTLSKNFSYGIAALLLLIAAGLYNRFQTKKKANQVLEKTLNDLKSTQQQLVQQEKLASLGALTAGIAHEIKNPLNFVNNFSELSTELIDEFIETTDEEERKEIGADLKLNLSKINEHGKRADSIVKNMLQHSRTGSGEKQLTDINQLCDEYFNLAFHGKRASNPGFNCEMIKQFDNNLPQVNCVTQDISRVILNLIGNAFDAVRERVCESERESEGAKAAYRPTVTVITALANQHISISIKDNGKGIPSHIKEKIFEPFFTTKAAGQGTGLGLSLSNDIIKAHGGELKVESKEGEGSTFTITLAV